MISRARRQERNKSQAQSPPADGLAEASSNEISTSNFQRNSSFAAGFPGGSILLHPLDVRAELAQFFVEMLVTAIDVIHPAHFRSPFGLQSRQDQRG